MIRVWELPTETLLTGGLGTLQLAPISATTEAALPGVIGRMEERLSKVESQSLAKDLWVATYVLMGLRYDRALVKELLRGMTMLEESTTYQEILEKGIAKGVLQEARKTLLRQGGKRFGPPGEGVVAPVEAINDLDRLEQLTDRIPEAASWEELLALPQ